MRHRNPKLAYHLSRPWTSGFAATLLILAGGSIAGIAGVAAGIQAISRADRRTWSRPAWGVSLLSAFIGLFVGAVVFGTVARTSMPAATDPVMASAEAEIVVAEDILFTEAPGEVPSGQLVVELRNEGNLEHDFTFAELGDAIIVAQPGQTSRGAIKLNAGTYTYYCSIPGHRDAGMEGTLTVVP
jgi:uncharacterized cupredoxin-like copper-binding protein